MFWKHFACFITESNMHRLHRLCALESSLELVAEVSFVDYTNHFPSIRDPTSLEFVAPGLSRTASHGMHLSFPPQESTSYSPSSSHLA